MTDLISRLRGMIHDPSGADEVFDDETLQGFLDDARTDVNYLELAPRDSIAPGGTRTYKVFDSHIRDWEASAEITGNDYTVLSPDDSDYRRGVWTFATAQNTPMYVTGSHYDLAQAAVVALEEWMAQLKFGNYDFTADGATFKRSQQIANMEAMIARYQQMSGVRVMKMTRSDVIC